MQIAAQDKEEIDQDVDEDNDGGDDDGVNVDDGEKFFCDEDDSVGDDHDHVPQNCF